jgi:hypothetical protein
MIPPDKSHVKILLRNNTIAEGIVQEWSDTIKLQSLDDQSYMIILHPKEDIILIKVFLEDAPEEKEEIKPTSELEQKFQQIIEQPSDEPTRHQSLAELRVLLSQQERQILANKLRQHHLGETKKVEYGYPRFFKSPRSK